jgi:hypothetical protein
MTHASLPVSPMMRWSTIAACDTRRTACRLSTRWQLAPQGVPRRAPDAVIPGNGGVRALSGRTTTSGSASTREPLSCSSWIAAYVRSETFFRDPADPTRVTGSGFVCPAMAAWPSEARGPSSAGDGLRLLRF